MRTRRVAVIIGFDLDGVDEARARAAGARVARQAATYLNGLACEVTVIVDGVPTVEVAAG